MKIISDDIQGSL
ncbi:Chaperone protein dnaJ [Zea mays]|uniref:Chaperone protein dnaJ n=1 Tax=Zea mays TaxID=4577 RepID=A0A1D6HKZ0_MAIZE|nr:Chaperone protein dnaJ [Zea mays]